MAGLSNHWEISNDDLMADEEFAEIAADYDPYDGPDFPYEVQRVADRIYNIHLEREVRGEFMFGYESNAEGDLQSASVAIACEGEYSLYLYRWLDLKHLTDDRQAVGLDAAFAIRDALMAAYADVRTLALKKELI